MGRVLSRVKFAFINICGIIYPDRSAEDYMSDRWEERKEQLATFRTEYSLLFPDLHFFQGLRFAVLGSSLPIAAGLFSYYRTALPFVKDRLFTPSPIPT